MELELNKVYRDRMGVRWKIVGINGKRQSGVIVTGARWQDKTYHTRIFRWDGRYWEHGRDDPWDLIAEEVV